MAPHTRQRAVGDPDELASFDPGHMQRQMERQLAAIQRIMKEHEFASAEEANAFVQEMLAGGGGHLPEPQPETPLEQAQELVYQALEAKGRQRLQLLRRALELSPDCADAYVLLANGTADPREARRLYEEAVRAGERAIGPELFAEARGEFWGILETRPYMRARQGLAEALWYLDERQQAIDHLRAMLELNPNDNQGVRYTLAHWLLEVGDVATLAKLLARYREETSAEWTYTGALLDFRQHGAGRKADAALRRALDANPFVPAYLLGGERLPTQLPAYIGIGDRNEAASYVALGAKDWLKTPGALEWFADVLSREVEKREGAQRPPGRRAGWLKLLGPKGDDPEG